MKKIITLLAIITINIFVGCSDSSENLESLNTPMAGKVYGETFKATGGKSFLSGGKLSINITNVVADCSSNILNYGLSVSAVVSNKVGATTDANVVFDKKGETPLNVLNSTVIVESITESEVKVKIKANSTSNNIIEGVITIPFCK